MEEVEEDEGIAGEENIDDDTTEDAIARKDENERVRDEDDELAEYGLDKYDEEDTGEDDDVVYVSSAFFAM